MTVPETWSSPGRSRSAPRRTREQNPAYGRLEIPFSSFPERPAGFIPRPCSAHTLVDMITSAKRSSRDLTAPARGDSFPRLIVGQAMRCVRALSRFRPSGHGFVDPPPRLHTLKFHHARTWLALSLLLASGSARAAEAFVAATPELHAKEAVAGVPLVLGGPPAWVVMALGVAVVSITVLRRRRTPERARR